MSERDVASYETVFRLFREGHALESVMSGWQLSEERLADQLLRGYRAGLEVESSWLLPAGDHDRVLEAIRSRPDLSPVDVASQFKGRVSPHLVRVIRVACGDYRGQETVLLNEGNYTERLRDDLATARHEILIVGAEIKGKHWREYFGAFRRLVGLGGTVAFFARTISHLIVDDIKNSDIVVIEKRTHANFVLVDGHICWEGSLNFMLPPVAEEHIRRTESILLCDEVKDLHDLYV